jgi:hypothetical protein
MTPRVCRTAAASIRAMELSTAVSPPIFQWGNAQRQLKRTRRLLPDREAHLNALGFPWVRQRRSTEIWDRQLAKLSANQQRFGHCRVPWNWSKNVTLGRSPYTGTLRKQTNRNHRKQSHGSGLMNGVQAQRAD